MPTVTGLPRVAAASLATLALAGPAAAQDGELTQRPLGSTAAPYGYVEYLPPGYSAGAGKHPLVLMLHGAGERGDGTSQLGSVNAHGPTRQIGQGETFWGDRGAVVIAPQAPSGGWWSSDLIEQLLDAVVDERRIDTYQVVVTGLSMGGGGTWDYVAQRARDRVAVALPICGASGAGNGTPFVGTATWAFHAWGDGVVGRGNSIGWVDAVADARAGSDVAGVLTGYPHQGGDTGQPAATDQTARFDGAGWGWVEGVDAGGDTSLRLTLYPDGSHDSWTRTYDAPSVREWMMSGRRTEPEVAATADVVVDDLDAGATFEGAWVREEDAPGFYGWDEHRAEGGAAARAVFSALVPSSGRYEVFVSYAAGGDRAVVPVLVRHAGGESTVDLDQKVGGGFVSLGEFDFEAAVAAELVIDATGLSGAVIADAMALRSVGGGEGGGGPGSGGGDAGSGAGGPGSGGSDDDGDGDGEGDGDGDGDGPGPSGGPGSGGPGSGGVGGAGGGAEDGGDAAEDDGGCDCVAAGSPRRDGPRGAGAVLVVGAALAMMRRGRARARD